MSKRFSKEAGLALFQLALYLLVVKRRIDRNTRRKVLKIDSADGTRPLQPGRPEG